MRLLDGAVGCQSASSSVLASAAIGNSDVQCLMRWLSLSLPELSMFIFDLLSPLLSHLLYVVLLRGFAAAELGCNGNSYAVLSFTAERDRQWPSLFVFSIR